MNLKRLSHAVALAEERSFSKAAERMNLGQSALSKSISTLEEEIGVRIFSRTTSSVALTPMGERVIEHARFLLSEATNFRKNLEYLKTGVLGDVAVGCGPFLARCFLDDCIREFHNNYPSVGLKVRIGYWNDLLEDLKAGHIDLFMADIRTMEDNPLLQITPIGGVTVGLFCDAEHPLVLQMSERRLVSHELLDYPFSSVSLPKNVLEDLCDSLHLEPGAGLTVNIECEDSGLLARVARGSGVICFAGNRMVAGEVARGELVRLSVPMKRNRFGEWALVQIRNRTLSPSAARLADIVVQVSRAGSLADDRLHGLPGNRPLNFLREPLHRVD